MLFRSIETAGERGWGGSVCCTLCPENSFSPPRPGRKATPPHRITSEAEPAPSTTPPPHLPSLQVSPQPQPLSVYISKPTEMTEPSIPPWQTPLPGKSNGVKNILCFVLPDTLIFCAESPNFERHEDAQKAVDDKKGMQISRSEERRVGKECLRLCRSRWSPYH